MVAACLGEIIYCACSYAEKLLNYLKVLNIERIKKSLYGEKGV